MYCFFSFFPSIPGCCPTHRNNIKHPTPATLCDDVNHPTIQGPIWQLPTLEAFANMEVNETPVLANAPLCLGLKLLGDPQEALKDWLHYGCQHAATHTS